MQPVTAYVDPAIEPATASTLLILSSTRFISDIFVAKVFILATASATISVALDFY